MVETFSLKDKSFGLWETTSKTPPFWVQYSGLEGCWVYDKKYKHIINAAKYIENNFNNCGYPPDGDSENNMYLSIIQSYAVKHAIEFSDYIDIIGVECGVSFGGSSYIELSEMEHQFSLSKISKYHMHLYDSWSKMRGEDCIYKKEQGNIGNYDKLDISVVKNNLDKFKDMITYHKGYIPEILDSEPNPSYVSFMHIDLNSAQPTIQVLNKFYPLMTSQGTILFDDYGGKKYTDTKREVDKFFEDKPGIMLTFTTGQSIYFCNKKGQI